MRETEREITFTISVFKIVGFFKKRKEMIVSKQKKHLEANIFDRKQILHLKDDLFAAQFEA